jgi:heme/copper-type cytochrome/quinol oxidase subunit 3
LQSVALAPVYPLRRRQLVPSGVLGMLIFVMTEVMVFAGFISAFAIVKASAPGGWPPPGQPRLPIEATAFNTAALLASGVVLFVAQRRFASDPLRAQRWLLAALGLGGFFVLFQGFEWVRLIGQGLTLTSSNHGSFFYLIVGAHALHAVIAIGALFWVWTRMARSRLVRTQFQAVQVFWYFVVGIWPVLYLQVYL